MYSQTSRQYYLYLHVAKFFHSGIMKRLTRSCLLISCFLPVFGLQAQQKIVTYYDAYRQYVNAVYYILDNDSARIDGPFQKFHPNGVLEAEGNFALPIEVNVLEKTKVQEALSCAAASMGTIDILINGAGGNKKEATTSPDMSFFDIPSDAMQFVFNGLSQSGVFS